MKSSRLWMPGLAGLLVAGVSVGMLGCGDDKVIKIDVPADATRADGKTAAPIVVTISQGEKMLEGDVEIASDLGVFDDVVETPEESDKGDTASGTLTSGVFRTKLYSAKAAEAHLTVTFKQKVKTGQAPAPMSATATLKFGSVGGDVVASITYVSAEPKKIGLAGAVTADSTKITFQCKDANGGNVPEGIDVAFALSDQLGGATLVPETAKTDSTGKVQTVLRAGNQPGSVRVTASVGKITADSEPITIAGGVPNYSHMTFYCDNNAMAGFAANLGSKMDCHAQIGDRNGQGLPNVQVTFLSEAGLVVQTATTDSDGIATFSYQNGNPDPVDVPPLGASEWGFDMVLSEAKFKGVPPWLRNDLTDGGAEPSRDCTKKNAAATCNPRDGLVTMIAVVSGEEGWNDANNNTLLDPGEEFYDLPEPYVDVNDNGAFDSTLASEKAKYIDANKNSVWDPKNGQWDSKTQIWIPLKILWTGDIGSGDPVNTAISGFYPPTGAITDATRINTAPTVTHCGVSNVRFGIFDDNWNMLATYNGNSASCTAATGLANITPSSFPLHSGKYGRRLFNLSFGDNHCTDTTAHAGTDTVSCSGEFTKSVGAGGSVGVGRSVLVPVQ